MKILDLTKTASDLAFETVNNNGIETDAAIAAKANELKLPIDQYDSFKRRVANFRATFAAANAEDLRAAANNSRRGAAKTSVVTGASTQAPQTETIAPVPNS